LGLLAIVAVFSSLATVNVYADNTQCVTRDEATKTQTKTCTTVGKDPSISECTGIKCIPETSDVTNREAGQERGSLNRDCHEDCSRDNN